LDSKAEHLVSLVDWRRPELESVRSARNRVAALVGHFARPGRPRFRFEYDRKTEALAFLREHYAGWRDFQTQRADSVASRSIGDARRPRGLADVSELGKAWWATGDPSYGAAFQRFYVETPTGGMFNWGAFNGSQGALELDAWFLLQDCEGFTTEGRIAFLDHLHAIAEDAWDTQTSRWEQVMLGPEGHNWYLHGMHVLPLVGLLFPEFLRAPFFLRTGWSVVEEHVRGHYKADGGARETTPSYQAGSARCLWDLFLVAHRNGHPMSEGFADRVLSATRFLMDLASPVGGLPSFGDSHHSPGDLAALAAVACALTGDRRCKWYAEQFRLHTPQAGQETPGELPERAFWRVGLAGAATYRETRPLDPRRTSLLFGPTGYAVLRDADRPDGCYMAVAAADRGPIVTSHGHNDIFAIEVHARGVRFLGEMGCAPYGGSPGRAYDQKTEAHNCFTVVGRQQAQIVNEWRWASRTHPVVRRWISEDTHEFFHGVHEGFYVVEEAGALHARKIFFLKSFRTPLWANAAPYWVVMDWVESHTPHDYRAYFHGCVPGELRGNAVILGEGAGPRLAIVPPQGDELCAEAVSDAGLSAYIEEKGLEPQRYPCFACGRRSASDCFAWVLIPLGANEALPSVRCLPVAVNGVEEDAHGATALEVAFQGYRDLLCVSHKDFDAELAFGPLRAWGHLAFGRAVGAAEPQLLIEHTMADGACGP